MRANLAAPHLQRGCGVRGSEPRGPAWLCRQGGMQGGAGIWGVPQLNFSIPTAGRKQHPEQQVMGTHVSSGEVSTLRKTLGSPGPGVLNHPHPAAAGPSPEILPTSWLRTVKENHLHKGPKELMQQVPGLSKNYRITAHLVPVISTM